MAFDFAALKLQFFDSPGVVAKAGAARRKALSKFGAFVRRRAKSSVRKRKAAAPPGKPPSSHAGQLRDLIFFAWDESARSVVVGPVPFDTGKRQDPGAPAALEYGGAVTRRGRKKPLTYRGNPFMGPALDAERPKFVSQFKNSL